MIQGKTSEQYFATELDSSSSLKVFSQNRRLYYKKYVSREKVEEEDSKASVIGRLTETKLLEPELFDTRFYLSASNKALTGKMNDFVNALVDITIENTDESGNITKSFEEMATEAREKAGFEWKLPTILEKFVGKDPEVLYRELREVKSKGLTVITLQDIQNCEKIVEELKTNESTAPIVNLVNSDRYEVYNQLQVEGFEIDGLKLKGMMDKCILDRKNKTVSIFDLKCTFSVEGFYEEYYLYRRAYIQAYLYKKAAEFYFKEYIDKGYKVLNPAFLVCDSISYYDSLVYTLNDQDMEDGYNGFTYKGREYPGVREIILDLVWAKENDKWRISRENYLKGGIVNIKE